MMSIDGCNGMKLNERFVENLYKIVSREFIEGTFYEFLEGF